MSLENWHVLAIQAKQRHERNLNRANLRQPQLVRKLLLVSAAVILLIVTAYPIGMYATTGGQSAISATVDRVSPAASGVTAMVYETPQSIALQSIGNTFTVQVKVANMAAFNGWDIQIVTADAPQVVNATSLSISGNIFAVNTTGGLPTEFIHCVNGVGTGCTYSDGPGVIHSAFADNGVFTSGNGLLFTVTFKVIGNSAYDSLTYRNSLISDPNSGASVPHGSLTAIYGTQPPQALGGGSKSLNT